MAAATINAANWSERLKTTMMYIRSPKSASKAVHLFRCRSGRSTGGKPRRLPGSALPAMAPTSSQFPALTVTTMVVERRSHCQPPKLLDRVAVRALMCAACGSKGPSPSRPAQNDLGFEEPEQAVISHRSLRLQPSRVGHHYCWHPCGRGSACSRLE
jgi:hypothetical protein